MPHRECSACQHADRVRIDAALRKGSPPLRTLAGQVGIAKSILHRHHGHIDGGETRTNTGQIERIDAEIAKLNRAQTRARKRRDGAGALGIARELRHWFTLRERAEALEISAKPQEQSQLTRSEAVAIARSLIESEVATNASDTIQWLCELAARIPGTNEAAPEPDKSDEDE